LAGLLAIGVRYAARTVPLAGLLSVGVRYAARTLPLAGLLAIGVRYAARTLPLAGLLFNWSETCSKFDQVLSSAQTSPTPANWAEARVRISTKLLALIPTVANEFAGPRLLGS
jgi:hypothetical protein